MKRNKLLISLISLMCIASICEAKYCGYIEDSNGNVRSKFVRSNEPIYNLKDGEKIVYVESESVLNGIERYVTEEQKIKEEVKRLREKELRQTAIANLKTNGVLPQNYKEN